MGLPTVCQLNDSRELMNQQTSSVASDLTEKIRECLKQRTSQSYDPSLGEEFVVNGEASVTDNTSSFLGQPPSACFKAHFFSKGQKERDQQIVANLHAAHLREEFKRALSQGGAGPTVEELQSEKRSKKQIKVLGNFYAKKMASRDRKSNITDQKVFKDDKNLVAPQEEYNFACELLTKQKNKERLKLLSTQCMQEPVSYQEFKLRQQRR